MPKNITQCAQVQRSLLFVCINESEIRSSSSSTHKQKLILKNFLSLFASKSVLSFDVEKKREKKAKIFFVIVNFVSRD